MTLTTQDARAKSRVPMEVEVEVGCALMTKGRVAAITTYRRMTGARPHEGRMFVDRIAAALG